MTIYKRKGSDNWYYEFQFKGQTYKGSTGTANKVEAQKVELKKRDEAQENHENQLKGVKRVTLKEAVDLWLAWADVNLAGPSHYHGIARKLFGVSRVKGVETKVRWGLEPTMKLHELCQADLMEIVDQRQQEELSNATINRELSLIQSVVSWATPRRYVVPPGRTELRRCEAGRRRRQAPVPHRGGGGQTPDRPAGEDRQAQHALRPGPVRPGDLLAGHGMPLRRGHDHDVGRGRLPAGHDQPVPQEGGQRGRPGDDGPAP